MSDNTGPFSYHPSKTKKFITKIFLFRQATGKEKAERKERFGWEALLSNITGGGKAVSDLRI